MRENYNIIEHPKTKSGLQIRRPERVYLCGHQKDFKIMQEVAKCIQDCYEAEVWISKDNEVLLEENELETIINSMTMIVILVSRSLLDEPNSVTKIVFPMAEKLGIRILPIRLEEGISADFASMFGKMQLIDYNKASFRMDIASYIERFVDSYFNFAEYITSIEESFTFRIFISYRKKDRVHLQKLINTIRNWDEQLASSIWFDDALIYGENYADQIKLNLEKSDLVLLLVTPNLLETDNYVMRCEYPDAVSNGKDVLPVLMMDTDLSVLSEYYDNISTPIPFENIQFLRNEIARRSSIKSVSPESLSSDCLYKISKGYTRGIGTELCHKMARRAMSLAAIKGNVWAMTTLSDLLEEEQNVELSINLAECAIDGLYQFSMNSEMISHNFIGITKTFLNMTDRLFRYYYEISEFDKAFNLLQIADSVCKNLKKYGVISSRFNDGIVCLWYGEFYFELGDLEFAYELFNNAEKPLTTIAERSPDVHSYSNLLLMNVNSAKCLTWMIKYGIMSPYNKVLLEARSRLEKAIELSEKLHPIIPDKQHKTIAVHIVEEYHRLISYFKLSVPEYNELLAMQEKEQAFIKLHNLEEIASKIAKAQENEFPINIQFNNSLDILKYKLDGLTFWYKIFDDSMSLRDLFNFGRNIPNGVLGDVDGNFEVSGYKCPKCGKRLYKTVFPEGKDPLLQVGIRKQFTFSPARVFACLCGRFYATPKGRKITEGPVFSATVVLDENKIGRKHFGYWWCFFDSIGKQGTRRNE